MSIYHPRYSSHFDRNKKQQQSKFKTCTAIFQQLIILKIIFIMASTNSRSSFSILPSHQNPLLSSLTLSPHFQIHRKRLSIVSHRRTRRRPRRKLAGGKDLSVAITMPTPSHRRDKSQDSVLDSTNSKFILVNYDQIMSIVIFHFSLDISENNPSCCTCPLLLSLKVMAT